MQNKAFCGWRSFLSMARVLPVILTFVFFASLMYMNPNVVQAQTVYENQAPMSERELISFINILPQFRAWAASHKEVAHPSVTQGKADFVYSKTAETWVKGRNWDVRRFFAVMGKAAAALYMISEGGSNKARPQDMPQVSQAELNLVQKHLTNLLEAGKRQAPSMAP